MDIDFSRKLIKGKIAELIFEEMFRLSDEFTVIPMGYEYTLPELAQYRTHIHLKKVLDTIRSAPDFVLISNNKERVFLVEVKYRLDLDSEEILHMARETLEKWDPSYIFIASHDGFYFDPSHSIVNSNGYISGLSENWVKKEIQNHYLLLLKEFIQ